MLKSISVTNFKNETLEMELAHPEKSGLIVYNIEGIGGSKANINVTDISNGDGAWYNSAHASSRNIVLYAKLLPQPSIEATRHNVVYKYFPLKKQLRLIFTTDDQQMYIDGYVESNETPIFSSEEYTTVSIICPDPYFHDTSGLSEVATGSIATFEFLFYDDSIVGEEIVPTLEFSEIIVGAQVLVPYDGTIDVGMTIDIAVLDKIAKNLTIINVFTNEQFVLRADKIKAISGSELIGGDRLIITTTRSNKNVTLLREANIYDLLGAVERGSTWLQLTAGNNAFKFDVGEDFEPIIATFSYAKDYLGV